MRKIFLILFIAASMQLFSADIIRTISVTGTGIINMKPDSVTVRTGVNSADPDIGVAIEQNSLTMSKVFKKLIELGIKEESIETSNYNVRFFKPYKEDSSEREEYRVSNNIRITVEDIDILNSVINSLVDIGVTQINGISFNVKNREEYNDELSVLALKDAKRKALVLADAEDMKVVSILSITEAGSKDYQPFMEGEVVFEAKAKSDVAISGGSESLTKSISVVYQIESK